MIGILGKKVGMTHLFSNGRVVPVTVIRSGPCKVFYKKSDEKEGYSSVALGFEPQKEHRINKPQLSALKKSDLSPVKLVREFRLDDTSPYEVGQDITVGNFEGVKFVDISGTTKGKGFQGVMKRYGFGGGPKSHGASLFHRRPGSIGSMASEGKVIKGKKMPGQMGNKKRTVKRLEIVERDLENNLLIVKGAVPGPKNGYLLIKPSAER